jgi:2'-5' RNA ligase
MRLFIALQFDDEIIEELEYFQGMLKDEGVTGNFTSRDNMHITLAFIGDYNDPDAVLDAMELIDFRPIDIELGGVGFFGDIFWAGIKENPQLAGYVKRLRHGLADAGIPFDKKKFNPHITLVRKFTYKKGDVIPVWDAPKGKMTVRGISLMRSDRGKSGMIYTEVGYVGED